MDSMDVFPRIALVTEVRAFPEIAAVGGRSTQAHNKKSLPFSREAIRLGGGRFLFRWLLLVGGRGGRGSRRSQLLQIVLQEADFDAAAGDPLRFRTCIACGSLHRRIA